MDAPIEDLSVSVFEVPTERPEADGTLQWNKTTIVIAEPRAGGRTGLGFTYGAAACGALIGELLAGAVLGTDAMDVPGAWNRMVRSIRNQGRPGLCSMAIAAVDSALWDLKGRLLAQPVCRLLGLSRSAVPVYGSGGFTSWSDDELAEQLGSWVHDQGIPRVKMKIGAGWGTEEERDLERITLARKAIGHDADLYVDANGAYSRKQAVRVARRMGEQDVRWFEEPVSSDDLDGLRQIRDGIDIEVAAGEYGYDLPYFERMLAAGAVDCLQADVSRCAGISEWMRVAAVAAAHGLQISGHCAPSLHLHPAAAVPNLRHLEYFHDHVRVEALLLDGAAGPRGGDLHPDLTRPGLGIDLKRTDAEPYRKG